MTAKVFQQITETLAFSGIIINLRRHNPKDYPCIKEILNDQATMKNLQSYFNRTIWDDMQVIERYQHFDSDPRAVSFTVIDRRSGKIVGTCGFKNLDSEKVTGEFGLIIHRDSWGTGATVECHLLCLDFAFERLGLKRVYF